MRVKKIRWRFNEEARMADSSSWQDMRRVVRESIGLIGFWMTLRYLLIYCLSYKPFTRS